MDTVILDPSLGERIRAERQATGADRYDEVWEGVYMMAPSPNNDHQEIATALAAALLDVVKSTIGGRVFGGVNLSDRPDDWTQNFRCPDVAVFLKGCPAEDRHTHWLGPADFLVEIISSNDRSRGKFDFYARLGVREVMIIDRQPWRLELYRLDAGQLRLAGQSELESGNIVSSRVVPLSFRLVPAEPRPRIEVTQTGGGRTWLI